MEQGYANTASDVEAIKNMTPEELNAFMEGRRKNIRFECSLFANLEAVIVNVLTGKRLTANDFMTREKSSATDYETILKEGLLK